MRPLGLGGTKIKKFETEDLNHFQDKNFKAKMRFIISGDYSWETGIGRTLNLISKSGYAEFFENKNYGDSVEGITIFLICHETTYKRRIRYLKKEKKLYVDFVLEFHELKQFDLGEKTKLIYSKIISELPEIVSKYKLKTFDLNRFSNDIKKCFGSKS